MLPSRTILKSVLLLSLLAAPLLAQESSANKSQSELALKQGRIADKYARLEQLMLKMAEIDGPSNPKRAELLKQAVQQSKDKLTRAQLESIVTLLDQQKLKRAIDGQTLATTEMKALLELLLSENRADRNKGEQDRVKEYIQEVERLIRLQKDIAGRTASGEKNAKAAQDQGKVADRTGDLTKKIQENEEPPPPQGQGQGAEEAKNSDEQPKPGEMPPAAPMPGQSKEGQPKEGGEPMSGAKEGAPPPAPENPARKRLQQAEQKMREAQKKLDEAQRDDAKTAQEAARQELERAKAELEEILRQLREEEIERTLAQLEARFRKMLEMQVKVLDATRRLESIPAQARGREVDIESGKLAMEERKIVLEADKAYNLLLEEGSSIAFPESVEQIRIDMEQVAHRLAKTNLDPVTVGIEEEIVAALSEMIKAMQQAQKDQEKQKEKQQDGGPQPEGGEQDQPLVDRIAELKMIKSMQLRVNERTQRFSKLLTSPDDPAGQVLEKDLLEAVEKLGERQAKLQRITRDIVLGKNQ